MIELIPLDKAGVKWAQEIVTAEHYLHVPVDVRCSVEGYAVYLTAGQIVKMGPVGLFLLGRPEATRCGSWYGGVDDHIGGKCEVTRWQVLNLARVWFHPDFQRGGRWYGPEMLPGFFDRKGEFRSMLASSAISAMADRVGFDYLVRRPPCFLDEPYQIEWLLSYCDTRLHRGMVYRAAGFELYRTNRYGIQTWRLRLPALSPDQDMAVRQAATASARSQAYRAKRAQMQLAI